MDNKHRLVIYEGSGLTLMALSIFFFFKSVSFLVANDYIGAVVAMLIGFAVLRGGVELSKLAVLVVSERSTR